jgi:CubicO group peptidase (beta-lactamase class C family)
MTATTTNRSTQIDHLFAQWDQPRTPGYIVAVQQGDEVVHCRGYGRANVEFDIPWTPDTRYRLASITKMFIGTAVLLLDEAGVLALDDDARRWLPELPDWGRPVTLRRMLTMTSGLRHEEAQLITYAGDTGRATLDYQFGLVCRQRGLNFLPGDHAVYACPNFRLAARVIERATAKPLNEALTELIYAPLGMNASCVTDYYADVLDNQATYYHVLDDGRYRRHEFGIASSGDGAMTSTINDLLRFNQHLRANLLGKPGFLERWLETAELPDGRRTNYGLGVLVESHRGSPIIGHGGASNTFFLRFPEQDLTVVILGCRDQPRAHSLVRSVADLFLVEEIEASLEPRPGQWYGYQPEDASRLATAAGRYVHQETGYVLELSVWQGALVAKVFGTPEVMRPFGDGDFVATDHASGLRVWVDTGDGPVQAVRADVGLGRPITFERAPAEPPPFDQAELEEFEGVYYCDELDVWQRVLTSKGRLVLQRRRGSAPALISPLTPVAGRIFIAEDAGIVVQFLRDEAAVVVGLREHINNARNVHFMKLRADAWLGRAPERTTPVLEGTGG